MCSANSATCSATTLSLVDTRFPLSLVSLQMTGSMISATRLRNSMSMSLTSF